MDGARSNPDRDKKATNRVKQTRPRPVLNTQSTNNPDMLTLVDTPKWVRRWNIDPQEAKRRRRDFDPYPDEPKREKMARLCPQDSAERNEQKAMLFLLEDMGPEGRDAYYALVDAGKIEHHKVDEIYGRW